jgi:hypothetical protein
VKARLKQALFVGQGLLAMTETPSAICAQEQFFLNKEETLQKSLCTFAL